MTKQAIRQAFERLLPAQDKATLEQAARSRSEADWIVGMNATRAATIRLRSSFDGAVSLGRVQTPTLAIIARREEEIRAFKPEPYWVIDALFAADADRTYEGRYHAGSNPRVKTEAEAQAIVDDVAGQTGEITKLDKTTQQASARRCSTTSPRSSATPTAASASRPGARWPRPSASTRSTRRSRTRVRTRATSPATWSGRSSRRPSWPGATASTRKAAAYVTGLDLLPLGRVVNDAKVTDHHAIIPTRSERQGRQDELGRPAGLRHGRAPVPRGVSPRRGVREHAGGDDRRRARLPHPRQDPPRCAGWRGVYGEDPTPRARRRRRGRASSSCPSSPRARTSDTREVVVRSRRRHSRRGATPTRSLLAAMETAGKFVDEDELREAMKDSGIGTPATRAAIIERLIDVGYIERDGRALVATEKGLNVIRLLDEHPLTSPGLTGDWERRLAKIEIGSDSRETFMADIAKFADRHGRRTRRQAQGRANPARQPRALPGVRPRHPREPQGLLVLGARGPRLRLRDLEEQGRQAAPAGDRQGADRERPHRQAGHRFQGPLGRARSGPGSRSSRATTASGASSSTSPGPARERSRRRPRPTRPGARRARPQTETTAAPAPRHADAVGPCRASEP